MRFPSIKALLVVHVLINGLPNLAQALPAPSVSFSLEQLWKTADSSPADLQSVESIISKLPLQARQRYVLIYKSRSLQAASPLEPRVVMFDDSAKYVATFNSGHAYQGGYNAIEMMRFNESSNSFELREINFNELGANVSKINPEKCLLCHGTNPRPLWDEYSLWAGIYGSADDGLFRTFPAPGSGFQLPFYKPEARENQYLDAFLNSKHKNPRYHQLAPQYVSITKNNVQENRPNNVLTHLLFDLNLKRIVSLISSNARATQFRFSFARAEFCGKPIDGKTADFSRCFLEFPEPLRSQLLSRATSNLSFIQARSARIADFQGERQLSLVGNEMMSDGIRPTVPGNPVSPISLATRYALFDTLGIPTQELSTDFYPLGFSNFTGDIPGDWLAFYARLQAKFDDLASLPGGPANSISREQVVELDSKNQRGAEVNFPKGDFAFSQVQSEFDVPKSTLQKLCIRCHMDGVNGAPPIPYHDESLFKQTLREHPDLSDEIKRRIQLPVGSNDHMPRGDYIDGQAIQEIVHYLDSLN
jgi:hypothetical protein